MLVDTTYLVTANYLNEYQDINGCDSSVYIHATVNTLTDLIFSTCDSVVYNGQTYTQSGTYTQVVANAPGCDSVISIVVNISTPANQPAFMNLIQTLGDTLAVPYILSGSSVEVDSMYNIYLCGMTGGDVPQGNMNGSEGFINRYDSSGNLIWKHIADDPIFSITTPVICLDDSLTLHSSSNNSGSAEGIIELFDINATYTDTTLWPLFGSAELIYDILNDPVSDKIVKIGTVPNPALFGTPNKVLVKRGNNTFSFNSPANAWGAGFCKGMRGAIDSQSNIYVTGSWQVAPVGPGMVQIGPFYCFIAKLDSNLNLIWNRLLGPGFAAPTVSINSLKFDHNSLLTCGTLRTNVDMDYTAGTYNMNIADGKAFVARFDTAANIIWAQPFGTSEGVINASTLTSDLNGNIYVGGNFSNKIDLEPGPGVSYYQQSCPPANWRGGYVSKFTSTGMFVRAMGTGQSINDLKFKAPKRIYAAGNYSPLQVFELHPDTTIYTYPVICDGDSVVVGDSVYYQSGTYTNVFFTWANTDSIVITNLTVNPLPNVVANASDTSLCPGDSVVLFGSGALTYIWNNLVIDSVLFSPAGTNNYLVTGTDTNGCVNTDSIEIIVLALPQVMANATDTVGCFGDSIILFGSGALTYTWNNAVTDSVLFVPLATGFFVVSGTDTNGCTNQDSIQVIVNALPLVMANASDTSLCIGDSVILFGSGALNYTWNNAVTDSMIFMPTITNNYLVTGTDTNGCINTDSITVVVNALPNVVANASDTSVCIGNQVILFGTGADSFSWNNSVIDSVAFYPIDTAMYVVTGIDINGCIGQDSIEVITYQIPFPILVYSGDTLYCTNVSGVTYYWFKDTVAVDSLINYYVVTQNGNYEVLVVDSNGCVGADSISMLNIGYLTQYKSDLIKVYPNPTSGDINIAFEMKQAGDVELTINDMLGTKIYASKNKLLTSGNQRLKIDLTQYQLTTGIYFLNIIIDGKRNVVKFEYQK